MVMLLMFCRYEARLLLSVLPLSSQSLFHLSPGGVKWAGVEDPCAGMVCQMAFCFKSVLMMDWFDHSFVSRVI